MFALSVHVQAASILEGNFAFFTLEGFGMVSVSFAALVAHLGAAAVVFHVVGKVAGRDLFVANGTFFAMMVVMTVFASVRECFRTNFTRESYQESVFEFLLTINHREVNTLSY
jgi:uncharacterized membrane protein